MKETILWLGAMGIGIFIAKKYAESLRSTNKQADTRSVVFGVRG